MIDELDSLMMSEDEFEEMFKDDPIIERECNAHPNEVLHAVRFMLTSIIPSDPVLREKRKLQVMYAMSVRHRCDLEIPKDWIDEYINADNNRMH